MMAQEEEEQKEDEDVNMRESKGEESKDESDTAFRKANLMKFRNQQNKAKLDISTIFEGVEGFKMVGNQKKLEVKMESEESLQQPLREDFTFFKKSKVKFNCVDIQVNEYQIDPEELEAQKKHSSQYL